MSQKICQRCNFEFTCRADDIANCECSTIQLLDSTKEFLNKTHYDCLCNSCLLYFNDVFSCMKPEIEKHSLLEDKHYYLENGLVVFTEYFHILKGNCCKSNCRHCAYGFRLAKK